MKEKEWDYSIPVELLKNEYHGTQEDWNQTLVTWFNAVTSKKRGYLKLGTYKIVFVPDIYEKLINTLLFYNEEICTISDKYYVQFYDGCNGNEYLDDYIYFPYSNYKLGTELTNKNSAKLKIINYKTIKL